MRAALLLGTGMGGMVARAQPASNATSVLTSGGTGAGLGVLRQLGALFTERNPGMALRVLSSLGSGGGIKGVAQSRLAVAVSSRPLTPDELASGLVGIPLGRTPVVLATSRSGVADITVQRIAGALEGREVRWPDGAPMRLVLRPFDDSDSQALASYSGQLAAGLRTALARPGVMIAQTDQDAADQLERVPGSLGTTTLTLLHAESRKLQVLALDGHQPQRDGQPNAD